jgi:hypothetical protein
MRVNSIGTGDGRPRFLPAARPSNNGGISLAAPRGGTLENFIFLPQFPPGQRTTFADALAATGGLRRSTSPCGAVPMRVHPESPVRWRRLRSLGRIGLALTAGGAFVALSWEPQPAASKPSAEADAARQVYPTAERQGVVKEDAASPHLNNDPACLHRPGYRVLCDRNQYGIREEDGWGLVWTGSRRTSRSAGTCGADATASVEIAVATPTTTDRGTTPTATAGVNPRGPP